MEPHSNKPKVVPLFDPERLARIKEEEKRRTMPELLMLMVIWCVAILCVAPVLLLAFVGY
ncbi:MAG: hypothetical protein AAFP13_10795 [Pseudomonadota bacterium]